MSRFRAGGWAFSVGVLSVVAAALLFRIRPLPAPMFIVLLIWCVGVLAAVAGGVAGITPRTGALAGVIAVAFVIVIFAATVATAPMEPGARRPGPADMLWTPLLAVVAIVGVCALAGFYGVRAGVYLATRRRHEG
jgi:hypothetical protein